MKKKTAILSALVISAAAGAAFSASASDTVIPMEERYQKYVETPYCYFKAEEVSSPGIHLLDDSKVYINRKNVTDDIVIPAELYYYDRLNSTWWITYRVLPRNDEIEMTDIQLPETGTFQINTPLLSTFQLYGRNGANGTSHPDGALDRKAMKTTGENTDDHPLCTFNCKLAADTPLGAYSVGIIDDNPYLSYADIRYDIEDPCGEYSLLDFSKTLDIVVSDRDLGDVDRSGVVDEDDAQKILNGHAAASNNDGSGFTQGAAIAADVNFDGEINAEDAELIMDYSLSGTEMSFSDYLAYNNRNS